MIIVYYVSAPGAQAYQRSSSLRGAGHDFETSSSSVPQCVAMVGVGQEFSENLDVQIVGNNNVRVQSFNLSNGLGNFYNV